jgi:hypothetical protein
MEREVKIERESFKRDGERDQGGEKDKERA